MNNPLATTPQPNSIFGSRLFIGLLVTLVAGVIGLLVYVPNCKVQGYEFNPKTWQVRQFEFWAEPFTNIQFTAILHDTKPISIDVGITACLNNAATFGVEADRWDLVELRDFHKFPSRGPASNVVDAVTTHKYGWSARPIQFWNTWTLDNPKKATTLWRAVHVLTVYHAYFAVPDLLELALIEEEFDEAVKEAMSRALLQQAKTFKAEGDLKSASATASEGLNYDATNPELKSLAKG